MRVVVSHPDPEHPNAAPAAYRLGRVQAGVDFVTGEERTEEQIIETLLAAAREEYPESEGYKVSVERFVDKGDGTGEWVPRDQATTSAPPGAVQDVTLEASVTPTATAGTPEVPQ